ncbi:MULTISPECIES: AbrB/MazE/SpoVT family DNA-binding domain-containing protein [Bacillus cereus group]|uniref:SpoVT-AbrB domain-containing protein n=1 Tax=Bacillus anthracis TaxID=1392 RepID=A0A0J1HUS9_BACAN|nr:MULTISPECIES: AbrB/MazE/SpoVT family DNA-binding domain-containing protein [Bacillus cereus group]KLV17456.1 hypothetical protein ABW01_16310 [Bacillus anthracis]KXY66287.1 hypothetical protein AT275_05265 [Bacillus cereus]MCD2338324.1 AbrB/MazE/SpoVT family DNA-binding domain-containing protein [Bacillus cereus]MDA2043946.1 AbrB/MazE/SpoVT family DNA-binding domain-containing protein [Bacillus cereus]MDA2290804.1 AbrB/MazE/SpoVT family DNA-binding domain-containing protein [Bacillus cereus
MKSTGIVRKLDSLGRVVIPMELRRSLGIGDKAPLEILVDQECIILKPYQPKGACIVTGDISDKNISLVDGKINLSPEGARELVSELEKYLQSVK